MAEYTNSDVYADPITYDLESGEHDLEGSILLRLANEVDGPVLELGCGTGRVTIAMAERGLDLTGLELSSAMLERARKKAASLPITWVQANACDFQLDRRYGLIFTAGAVIQHLLERADQEAMLARAREHLTPDGRFVLDATFKRPDKMLDAETPTYWYTFTDEDGNEVIVSGSDRYDHVRQIWTQKFWRRTNDQDDHGTVRPVTLTLRYFMPQELESLLRCNGFVVLERYGNWQGTSLTDASRMQIYVCARG